MGENKRKDLEKDLTKYCKENQFTIYLSSEYLI